MTSLLRQIECLLDALTLPMLFHQGGRVTQEMVDEWERITGTREMTTRVMCDTIRETVDATARIEDEEESEDSDGE